MLNFPRAWRFRPPAGNEPIPDGVVADIFDLIRRTAAQDQQPQRTLERFKAFFAPVAGAVYSRSTNTGWAETDLLSLMQDAIANAPLCTAPGFLDTRLRYAAWRSSYCSRASSGVRYASFSRRQH